MTEIWCQFIISKNIEILFTKYYKIDDYLSEHECAKLIQDAREILQGESFVEVQNFRKLIPYC